MNAQPESVSPAGATGTSAPVPSSFDHQELRSILAHLSHALSRPLVSLRAGIDLLQPVAPEQRGHVETMAALCDDMLRLTRDYLDYAGLVHCAQPPCYGAFTLSALVREIDRAFAKSAAERRIGWECTLDGPDATVATDASRCQQLFCNLVTNALNYTPAGSRVGVVARREGDHWHLVVSDTGPGIPSEALGKVLEPFYRLARDERLGIEGCGLGLAVCRELVNQMDGALTIDSAVGEGTRVAVRFPVAAHRG